MNSKDLFNANRATHGGVRRRDVKLGQTYTVKGKAGKVYMALGAHTDPPSGSTRGKDFGRTAAGKKITGFQSLVVSGDISAGEDGLSVTWDGDKEVTITGHVNMNYVEKTS